jgi:hypothetical protein
MAKVRNTVGIRKGGKHNYDGTTESVILHVTH